jgi:hypothetical protein
MSFITQAIDVSFCITKKLRLTKAHTCMNDKTQRSYSQKSHLDPLEQSHLDPLEQIISKQFL